MAKVAKNSQTGKSVRGGAKPGERRGGRKKGTPNKKNAEVIKAVEEGGVTPLAYMLGVMRNPIPVDADSKLKVEMTVLQFEAAKAAAPYVHPRLAAVEHTGKGGGPIKSETTVTVTPDEAYKMMLDGS